MDSQTKMSRAVTKLCNTKPFFGSLALSVGHREEPSCPTAMTDGRTIKWNSNFIDELTEEETRGILAHELMHIIFFHCQKHGLPFDDNHAMTNIAMDIVINQLLLDDGFTLPAGGVVPEERFKGMYWKDVFRIIILEEQYQKMAESMVIDVEWSDLTDEEKMKVKQKTIAAAEAAKSRGIGKLPGSIEELIKEIRSPKVDWKEYLHNTFSSRYPEDYSWTKPNRKYLNHYGIYMPTMVGTRAGNIVVHIDTSGSVRSEELEQFLGELNYIADQHQPEKVYLLYTDYEVANVQIVEQGEEIEALEVKGRGGTSFVPSFDWIKENDIEVDQMLVFSDMEVWDSCFPDESPEFPVLFISTRDHYDVPFGDIVVIKE